jgi:hypothetical protein
VYQFIIQPPVIPLELRDRANTGVRPYRGDFKIGDTPKNPGLSKRKFHGRTSLVIIFCIEAGLEYSLVLIMIHDSKS